MFVVKISKSNFESAVDVYHHPRFGQSVVSGQLITVSCCTNKVTLTGPFSRTLTLRLNLGVPFLTGTTLGLEVYLVLVEREKGLVVPNPSGVSRLISEHRFINMLDGFWQGDLKTTPLAQQRCC